MPHVPSAAGHVSSPTPLRASPSPFLIYLAFSSSSPSLTAAPNNKLQEAMAPKREPAVLPHALRVPGLTKLTGKRVVLASASPRRREILRTFVSERAAVLPPWARCVPHADGLLRSCLGSTTTWDCLALVLWRRACVGVGARAGGGAVDI